MDSKRFVLDSRGVCSICEDIPSVQNTIKCHSCKETFHGLCPTASEDDFICRKTFLQLWHGPSCKPNFQWHCNSCLTKQEEKTVSSMEDRLDKLINTVTTLSNEVSTLKSGFTSDIDVLKTTISSNVPSQVAGNSSTTDTSTMWFDQERLRKVKGSLVIKNKPGTGGSDDTSADLLKLKKVGVDNKIPVSRVDYDKNGNTFVDCPSVSDCTRLQPLLVTDFQDEEVSVLRKNYHVFNHF